MTIWIMHLPLTAAEESQIMTRTHLPLPLTGLPDLSMITNPLQLRHLIQALNPEAPPETIERTQQRIWNMLNEVHPEDLIAVPLQGPQKVVVAEITGPYIYNVGGEKEDLHLMPVKWYPKTIPFSKFRNNRKLLNDSTPLLEVQAVEARNLIRTVLPHKYNRFVGLKWIVGIFALWQLFLYLSRQFQGW